MDNLSSFMAERSKLISVLSLCPPLTIVAEFFLRGNPIVTLLAMIPANSFLRRTFTWNIFTHMLVETDVFMCLLGFIVLQTWGTIVVREVGVVEVGKLIVGINALIGLLIVIAAFISHPHTMWVYEYHCGPAYTLSVIIMLMAQLSPDAMVFPAFNELRARHMPVLFGLFASLYDQVRKGPIPTEDEAAKEVDVWRGHCAAYVPIALWATWLYLRQTKPSVTPPLHEFFYPQPVQEAVLKVSTAVAPIGKVFGIGAPTQAELFAGFHGNTMFAPTGTRGHASVGGGGVGGGILQHAVINMGGGGGASGSPTNLVPSAAGDGTTTAATAGSSEPSQADRQKQLARSALAKRLGEMGTRGQSAVVPTSAVERTSAAASAIAARLQEKRAAAAAAASTAPTASDGGAFPHDASVALPAFTPISPATPQPPPATVRSASATPVNGSGYTSSAAGGGGAKMD